MARLRRQIEPIRCIGGIQIDQNASAGRTSAVIDRMKIAFASMTERVSDDFHSNEKLVRPLTTPLARGGSTRPLPRFHVVWQVSGKIESVANYRSSGISASEGAASTISLNFQSRESKAACLRREPIGLASEQCARKKLAVFMFVEPRTLDIE